MAKKKMYNVNELCEALEISYFTLTNWYKWENKRLKSGEVTEHYLPEPYRMKGQRGNPRAWDTKMLKALKKYKSSIVIGRNGIFGEYTNPVHKQTRKYKKQQETSNEQSNDTTRND